MSNLTPYILGWLMLEEYHTFLTTVITTQKPHLASNLELLLLLVTYIAACTYNTTVRGDDDIAICTIIICRCSASPVTVPVSVGSERERGCRHYTHKHRHTLMYTHTQTHTLTYLSLIHI